MRALVTGVSGFAGRHLADHLYNRGYLVHGTYLHNKPSAMSARVKLYQCDVRDPKRLRALLRRLRPDRIYHLAAESSVRKSFSNVRTVFETNFWGIFNLLEAVRLIRPRSRVLVVTSSHCYGSVTPGQLPVTESHPLSPQSPYALSKTAADMLAAYYHHRFGLHVIRARPFNHTGPGQSPEFVCSDFARQIASVAAGSSPAVLNVGNLKVRRDFSDVRDVVHAYELLMEKGKPGEAYNVASGKPISLLHIVRLLASLCVCPVKIRKQMERVRPAEAHTLYGSNLKLRRATGWKAEYDLGQTIGDLYEWWRKAFSNSWIARRPFDPPKGPIRQ